MSKFRSAALMVLALPLWPISANADWQYTKWGMTPEQVQAAAGGQLSRATGQDACPECKPVPLLLGNYSAGEFQFRARFEFDRGTALSSVVLDTASTGRTWGCNSLFNSLSAKYGDPVWRAPIADAGTLANARWLDPQGGNTVFFNDASGFMGKCGVTYSPLASSKGL